LRRGDTVAVLSAFRHTFVERFAYKQIMTHVPPVSGFRSGASQDPRIPVLSPVLRFSRLGMRMRNLHGLPPLLARLGSLELRLAVTKKEIRKAQRLRWQVFVRDGGARIDYRSHLRRRDICPFDRICDHLIVVDREASGKHGRIKPKVVGTYRLLRQEIAEANHGFYSATEFDIAGLLARHPGKRFLELGRSCILPEYRARKVLELLWRGLWIYARHHNIDVMVGCASLPGTDPDLHRDVLAGIHERALATGEWRVAAMAGINRPIATPIRAWPFHLSSKAICVLAPGSARAFSSIGNSARRIFLWFSPWRRSIAATYPISARRWKRNKNSPPDLPFASCIGG